MKDPMIKPAEQDFGLKLKPTKDECSSPLLFSREPLFFFILTLASDRRSITPKTLQFNTFVQQNRPKWPLTAD